MRTIKFRGKTRNGEWRYGDLLWNNGEPIIVVQVNREYIETQTVMDEYSSGKHWFIKTPAWNVIPETVGQFTGLLDKNGKEVYEGDVFERDNDYSMSIAWDDETASWGLLFSYTNADPDMSSDFYVTDYIEDGKFTLEVIGNLHDQ